MAGPTTVQALSGKPALVLNSTEYEAPAVPVNPNWKLPLGSQTGLVRVGAAAPACVMVMLWPSRAMWAVRVASVVFVVNA